MNLIIQQSLTALHPTHLNLPDGSLVVLLKTFDWDRYEDLPTNEQETLAHHVAYNAIPIAIKLCRTHKRCWAAIHKQLVFLAFPCRTVQTLVPAILTYACEIWTLLAADIKRLEAFHMKCQRQIAKIRWQNHMLNTDVSSLTGLVPVLDPIIRHCCSLFGHVVRLPEDTPAHLALWCHIDLSLGHLPYPSWRRCPGRP